MSRVFDRLAALGIPAMLVGSHASSLHGDARSTHDVDVVVEIDRTHVEPLLAEFPAPTYYASRSAAEDAIRHRTMFSVTEIATGYKVDFFLVGAEPFDRSAFARRREERVGTSRIAVMTPEDVILQKLRWARLCGGSERQFHDALGVYELQHSDLDHSYLETWLAPLGIEEDFRRLLAEARDSGT